MTLSTELPRDYCAGIGPLQLGVVLVLSFFLFFVLDFVIIDIHEVYNISFQYDFSPIDT